VADWGVVCLLAAYCGPNSPLACAIYGLPLACATLLQSMPVCCHFRGCTVPLQQFICDSVTLIAVHFISFFISFPETIIKIGRRLFELFSGRQRQTKAKHKLFGKLTMSYILLMTPRCRRSTSTPSRRASVTACLARATCAPAGISCRRSARSATGCAPSTTRRSRRRSIGPGRGSCGRRPPVEAVLRHRPPRRRAAADAVVDVSAAAAAVRVRPRTTCCTSTRRRTTANRTRGSDRWERTAGGACAGRGRGGRATSTCRRQTAASYCAADAATTRFVRRRWNAAAVGSTGAARSSAASANESSTCMSASRSPAH